jgi:hypothetical protein
MNDAAKALAEFLNDFIAHVVPGSALVGLFILLFEWPVGIHKDVLSSLSLLFAYVAISYGAGQLLSALHTVSFPFLLMLRLAVDEAKWADKLEASGAANKARLVIPGSDVSLRGRDLRNALMTLSPQSQKLAVRFQHISLMHGSLAFALLIGVFARLYAHAFASTTLRIHASTAALVVQSAVMFLVGVAALQKGMEFHYRSLRAPFSTGVAEIQALAAAAGVTK